MAKRDEQVTCYLPAPLKLAAARAGLNFSGILRQGIIRELRERDTAADPIEPAAVKDG
jgi:hypothetical protein